MSRTELEAIASGVDEIIDIEPEGLEDDEGKGASIEPSEGRTNIEQDTEVVRERDSDLNLEEVPVERRQEAIMDHFFKIMADSIHDQGVANEIKGSRVLKKGFKGEHFQKRGGKALTQD